MSAKKIVIRWPKTHHNLYKVSEGASKFYVAQVTGSIFTNHRSLSTTRSLQDALELIKADVGSSKVELNIRDW